MSRNRMITVLTGAASLAALVLLDRTVVRRRYGAGLLRKAGGATTVLSVRA